MCLSKRLNQQHVSNGAWIAHVQRSVCHHSSKRQTARAFLSKRRGVRQNKVWQRENTRSRRESLRERWFKFAQFRFAPKKRFRKEGPVRSPHTCTSWGRMMTVRYVGIITLRSVTCSRRRFSFSLLCVYPYTTSLFSHLVCEFRNRNVHKIVISSPFQCV